MKVLNLVRSPYTSLAFNVAYALGNCIIGFLSPSWWFITVILNLPSLTSGRGTPDPQLVKPIESSKKAIIATNIFFIFKSPF